MSLAPLLAFSKTAPPWAWVGFFLLIGALLAVDLGVFQRKAHEVKMREALAWCGVWALLALVFGGFIWWRRGSDSAEQYLAAYLVELCLSVDNVFVFILIFAYFKVAARWQHRVLFWGIIGAVAMRTVFILAGVGVIARFHWVLYLFGAFLVYTGVKLALPKRGDDEIDPEHNVTVRLFRKFFRVAPQMEGGRFFTRLDGRLAATPLLIVLIVVETTDVAFALDSIPAVLAITKSGFVALTSNIFAILGLRSLYFAVHGVMQLFRFLRIGLAVILVFIGAKMLAEPWVDVPTLASLAVIGGVLATSVLASILIKDPSKQ
ncbi:MAG TPA: TerC family protein [Opitutus sp.]|nr:TerC family protein [Opitutus sp.]